MRYPLDPEASALYIKIGETSAAALAAIGLAVADLWALRIGRRQAVAVDTRQATASLRSGRYMQLDGAPVSTQRNTVMGVYPAKHGRWSYFHGNFPNHRAAALNVLGVPEDREAVRQAVANWDALAKSTSRTCRRNSPPRSWRAGQWRATRRSVSSTISARWCASPRRRRAGPSPRCRSATTSRCAGAGHVATAGRQRETR